MALLGKTQDFKNVQLSAGVEKAIQFQQVYDDKNSPVYPNSFVIRQYGGTQAVKVAVRAGTASSRPVQSIISDDSGQFVEPKGAEYLYLYCTANADVDIQSWWDTDPDVVGLGVTQNVTITNSTTTSSVTISDGGDSAFGATTDAAQTNPGTNATFMSYVRGMLTVINTITGQLVSALAKQDSQTALLTTMDVDTGNIATSTNSVDTKLTTTNSSLSTVATNTGTTATNTGSIDTKLTTTNSSLSTVATNTDNTATSVANIDAAIVDLPTTPTIYNVTLTTANTEYSQALPSNTQRFSVSIIDGDGTANFRAAFITGKVATPTAPYLKYNDSVEFGEQDVNLTGVTLYLAHSVGSKTAQILVWA